MSQWFAPTKFIISFERDGIGRFSDANLEDIVVTDDAGRVTLNFPNKFILISNHQVRRLLSCAFRISLDLLQVYTDWWYQWSLMYFMGEHKDLFIVLKKSLKWLPVVGWVLFEFAI